MSSDSLWYFGTGSFLNPTSLRLRSIDVSDSTPATLAGFRTVKFGVNGYLAPYVGSEGDKCHGMLHKISKETLDGKISPNQDGSSDLRTVKVTTKDGSEVECVVHHLNTDKMQMDVNIPTEGYVAICVEGAQEYGMPAEFLEELGQLDFRPRKTPAEFLKWDFPNLESLPAWTMEEVRTKGFLNEGAEGTPIYYAFDDKVIEYEGPRGESFHNWGLFKNSMFAKQFVYEFAKLLYDPKYGEAKSWETMSPEMRAYYADWLIGMEGLESFSKKKVVGRLVE